MEIETSPGNVVVSTGFTFPAVPGRSNRRDTDVYHG